MITNKCPLCSGHESNAYRIDHSEYGKNIIMKEYGEWHDGPIIWQNKQTFARTVTDSLSKLPGKQYGNPKVFNIEAGRVYEQMMPGFRLCKKIFYDRPKSEQDYVICATASFMNDMHNLFPAISLKSYFEIRSIPSCEYNFHDALLRMKDFLTNEQTDTFGECARQLNNIESANIPVFVMCYADFKTGNTLYDSDLKKLSFIDFAQCCYETPETDLCYFREDKYGLNPNFFLNNSDRAKVIAEYDRLPKKNIVHAIPADVADYFDILSIVYLYMSDFLGGKMLNEPQAYEFYKREFESDMTRIKVRNLLKSH
jgi:hypothetical protein